MQTELLTDFYQLNMRSTYLDHGLTETAVFELFVRKLPPRRGFLPGSAEIGGSPVSTSLYPIFSAGIQARSIANRLELNQGGKDAAAASCQRSAAR
jgi:hypothetical protein